MAEAKRASSGIRRWLSALATILVATAFVLSSIGPSAPVAQAVTTRTGNLWTVAAGASSEIQPAIDSAYANGGGTVRLPAAVYLLTTKVRVQDNVTLYGDGIDRTILRWAPGITPESAMMSNATVSDGNTNIQIWSLTLDGQNLPRPSGQTNCCFGLRLNNVRNSFVVNVAVDGHSKDGIYMGYSGTNGDSNVRVSGCRVTNNARNGISLIHGDGNAIDHCNVSNNNRVERYAGINLEPDEGLSLTNNKIVANTANGQNVGIQLYVAYNGFATSYHNAVCQNSTSGNGTGVYFFRGDQNVYVNNQSNDGLAYLLDDSTLIGSQYAGYCGLGALPPDPATIAQPTSTPTITPIPTPTFTPTPRPSCTPRPSVSVNSRAGAGGTLQVTISVTRSAAAPNNTIQKLQFGPAQNAIVEIGGQTRPGGSFTYALPAGTQQTTFTVRRQTPGQTSTVPFTVVDDCGGWQTFVGGGPSAF